MLGAAVIAQVSISGFQQGLPALGPILQTTFSLDTSGTGAILGVGSLGTAVAVLIWGRLTDRTTDRFVAVFGLLLASASLGLAGFAAHIDSLPGLMLALFATGICAAAPTVALTKSIFIAFAAGRRMGLAFGIRQAAVPLGAAAAGVFLPILAISRGLAAALWGLAAMLLFAALVVYRAVHGERRTNQGAPLGPTPWAAIAPMLTASSLYTLTQIGVVSLLTLYLVNARGWSPPAAATVFTGVMVSAILLRILVGIAADRWPHHRLWLFKMAGMITATLLVIAALTDPAPISGIIVVIAGITGMGWNALAFTLTVSLVPESRVGTSQGALNASLFVAWGLSPILTGFLVETFSWSLAWIVLAFLAIIGAATARTHSFARQVP